MIIIYSWELQKCLFAVIYITVFEYNVRVFVRKLIIFEERRHSPYF
jgi:hypothetical protein